MTKELTCIICPAGCSLKVELEGKNVISVSGNTCKRGIDYATNECTNPIRSVTSTILSDKGPVSVKTDKAIPKDKIFECMEIINKARVTAPVKIGDVLIEDVFGSNIVATSNIE